MPESLRGMRVLVPRAGAWGDRVATEIRARDGVPIIAPVIEAQSPHDSDRVAALLDEISHGAFAWVFITSASTVEQLVLRGASIPASTKVAAVGRSTARALVSAGMHVDFLPAGQSSAESMIRQWCAHHEPSSVGRSAVLRGDLAMAAVSDWLETQGFEVEIGIVYRTVGVDLPVEVITDLRAGGIDAVLLTAGSVARELATQAAPLHPTVQLVAIGAGTARTAEALALTVSAIASAQTVESMLDRLADLHTSRTPHD